MGKLKSWFNGLSMTGKVAVIAISLVTSFGVMGAAAQQRGSALVQSQSTTRPATAPAPRSKIEVKDVTTTEAIPFTTSTTEDSTLDQGVTQTKITGQPGVLTHTYKVTYTDGVETSRIGPVNSITTSPVNEVIVTGTKAPTPAPSTSCPNGTYVNSVGNTVCSPYASSQAPQGATAQCVDGTYSFSQSRSGTCSHHGGVASWL